MKLNSIKRQDRFSTGNSAIDERGSQLLKKSQIKFELHEQALKDSISGNHFKKIVLDSRQVQKLHPVHFFRSNWSIDKYFYLSSQAFLQRFLNSSQLILTLAIFSYSFQHAFSQLEKSCNAKITRYSCF